MVHNSCLAEDNSLRPHLDKDYIHTIAAVAHRLVDVAVAQPALASGALPSFSAPQASRLPSLL